MSKRFLDYLVIFLCLALIQPPALGAIREEELPLWKPSDGSSSLPKQSVYVYGDGSFAMLMPVQILGAVSKPGIHYVPSHTDVLTLISLAGGTTPHASTEDITVKRQKTPTAGSEVMNVNLKQLVEDPKAQSPRLAANDTILVAEEKPFLSDNAVRIVTLVAGLAGIFLSATLGIQALSKK